MAEPVLDHFDDFDPADSESEVIAKYYSEFEAQMAVARLQSEGVPCFLANVNTNTILPSNIAPIRLHVKKGFEGQARDILTDSVLEDGPASAPKGQMLGGQPAGNLTGKPNYLLIIVVLLLLALLYRHCPLSGIQPNF